MIMVARLNNKWLCMCLKSLSLRFIFNSITTYLFDFKMFIRVLKSCSYFKKSRGGCWGMYAPKSGALSPFLRL